MAHRKCPLPRYPLCSTRNRLRRGIVATQPELYDARPFVVCHLNMTLNGQVDEPFIPAAADPAVQLSVAAARAAHRDTAAAFQAPTWLTDLATLQAGNLFSGRVPAPEQVVVLDPMGRRRPEDVSDSTIFVLSEEAAKARWTPEALDSRHVVAGAQDIDLPKALEELRTSFGIEALLVAGPQRLCSELLTAGLIDEVSLIWNPIIDLRPGAGAVFPPLTDTPPTPISMELLSVQALEDGILWARYQPAKTA